MRRLGKLGAMVVVLALIGAACSGGDDDDGPEAGAAPDPTTTSEFEATTTTAPRDCTPSAAYPPGTERHQLEIAGATREFQVHMPPEPTTVMPLVVNFHGANSDMNQQVIYSGFDPVADAEGFVVASPNGIDAAIRQWRFVNPDDVAFAAGIVDELVANACVDPDRVYATGISSGSAMSTGLACMASDRFAGFGLVAAGFYVPQLCDDAEARPMVIFHGTDDAIVPYDGGGVQTGQGLSVAPIEETAKQWAVHNGCAPEPVETEIDTEVVEIAYVDCDAPVVLYRIVGGGHTWPGASINVERLGYTTAQISATDTMWEFWTENSVRR